MKRILISIVFGISFPVIYTIVVALLTEHFPQHFNHDIILFGNSAPGLVFAPTLFSIYFDIWLKANWFFGLGWLLDNLLFKLFLFIFPVVTIYSLLAYAFLRITRLAGSKAAEPSSKPPPPSDAIGMN